MLRFNIYIIYKILQMNLVSPDCTVIAIVSFGHKLVKWKRFNPGFGVTPFKLFSTQYKNIEQYRKWKEDGTFSSIYSLFFIYICFFCPSTNQCSILLQSVVRSIECAIRQRLYKGAATSHIFLLLLI